MKRIMAAPDMRETNRGHRPHSPRLAVDRRDARLIASEHVKWGALVKQLDAGDSLSPGYRLLEETHATVASYHRMIWRRDALVPPCHPVKTSAY